MRIPAPVSASLAALLALAACGPGETSPELAPSTLKGHREIVLVDGRPTPLVLGGERPVSLCYSASPGEDPRDDLRIELLFDGLADGEGPRPATDRSESALCFRGTPPEAWRTRTAKRLGDPGTRVPVRICGRAEKSPGKTVDAGCVDAFYGDPAAYEALLERRSEVLRAAWNEPLDRVLPSLDGLARELRGAGFPQLAVNLELTALHFLVRDGSEKSLAKAQERLAALPDWLGLPFTEHLAAGVALQQARFLRRSLGRPAEAWTTLERAEELSRRVALPRLSAAHAMAQMVAAAGAVEEARTRLGAALEECAPREQGGPSRCRPVLEADARGTLAWMILLDGGAREDDLRLAERYLDAALEASEGRDPLEVINRRLDLAYLHLRLGEDPRPTLDAATAELEASSAEGPEAGRRRGHLVSWRTLILGLAEVRDGRPAAGVEHCGSLTSTEDPALAAWAFSCVARGKRLEGELDGAADAFAHALERHEAILDWQRGRRLPLGLDQRADDFARAARLAVERRRPEEAWRLLLRLDHLSVVESARRQCRQGRLSAADQAEWRRLDREAEEIHHTLESFEGPAPLDRRQARERLARDLKERLRELWRRWPGCEAPEPASDRGLDYRAFALDDEILLLHRETSGAVSVARRTPFERRALLAALDSLSEMAPGSADEARWRQVAAPLAEALVPAALLAGARSAGTQAAFALHGPLQRVPLVALPVDGSDGDGPTWLGLSARVAVQPAGAVGHGLEPSGALPLFVVDPSRNLPGAGAQAADYRELFPEAEILRGAEARHEAVAARLPSAEWIHFDTHGTFDAVLPEMSSLVLADRRLPWLELADLTPRARFVNLSGCETGRWPVTADSGSYGLSGLFTRLGSPWAVGSRFDLPDAVAAELNGAFYRAIRDGRGVPEAFRAGIERVAASFPAPAWSGLILLRAADPDPRNEAFVTAGGQSPVAATPPTSRPVREDDPAVTAPFSGSIP